MRSFLLSAVLLLVSCASTASPQSLVATKENSNKTMNLHVGQVFAFRLKENPTTGYQWVIDSLPENLTLKKNEYQADPTPAMMTGSGGKRSFVFKVKEAGTSTLKFKHWRSWEGDESIIGRFNVTIKAK